MSTDVNSLESPVGTGFMFREAFQSRFRMSTRQVADVITPSKPQSQIFKCSDFIQQAAAGLRIGEASKTFSEFAVRRRHNHPYTFPFFLVEKRKAWIRRLRANLHIRDRSQLSACPSEKRGSSAIPHTARVPQRPSKITGFHQHANLELVSRRSTDGNRTTKVAATQSDARRLVSPVDRRSALHAG